MRARLFLKRGLSWVVLGAAAITLLGCAALFATKIAEIKGAPSSYDGKSVTIVGTVTGAHDLLVVRYFEVDDGTGEIPVVTQGELPKEGARVHVRGRVDEAFVLGSTRLVVIVETPRKR